MKQKALRPSDFERHAQFLQALAHPVRLAILEFLAEGPRCGCEFEPLLRLDQSTISRHLNMLKRAGVLSSFKDGVKVMYQVKDTRALNLIRQVSALFAAGMRQELALLESKLGADHGLAV